MNDHDKMTVSEAGAKGGVARRKALSASARSEIARAAVQARWAKKKGETIVIPRATHAGEMKIGNTVIPCFVLENGVRVISHRGLQKSLGIGVSGGAHKTARFVSQFESKVPDGKDLTARMAKPIDFIPPNYGRSAYGYEATVLADICDVILAAREAGLITTKHSERVAAQCEILVRGFARVGIIALVDEATGYQHHRLHDELQRILEKYVSKELARYARVFQSDFYEHIHRLKGWPYDPNSTKRSHAVARLTVDLTYDRIHPELLKELKQVRSERGRVGQKLHQWLTTDPAGGHPRLKQHAEGVAALLSVAKNWPQFQEWIDRRYPKLNQTLPLPFPPCEEDEIEIG